MGSSFLFFLSCENWGIWAFLSLFLHWRTSAKVMKLYKKPCRSFFTFLFHRPTQELSLGTLPAHGSLSGSLPSFDFLLRTLSHWHHWSLYSWSLLRYEASVAWTISSPMSSVDEMAKCQWDNSPTTQVGKCIHSFLKAGDVSYKWQPHTQRHTRKVGWDRWDEFVVGSGARQFFEMSWDWLGDGIRDVFRRSDGFELRVLGINEVREGIGVGDGNGARLEICLR